MNPSSVCIMSSASCLLRESHCEYSVGCKVCLSRAWKVIPPRRGSADLMIFGVCIQRVVDSEY